MLHSSTACLIVACAAFMSMLSWGSGGRTIAAQVGPTRSLIDRSCITCHNSTQRVAGLALDHLDPEHVGPDAETWEKVLLKLRAGAMPPAGRAPIERRRRRSFRESLQGLTRRLHEPSTRAVRPSTV